MNQKLIHSKRFNCDITQCFKNRIMEKSSTGSIKLQVPFDSQGKTVQNEIVDWGIGNFNIRKSKVAIEYFTKANSIEPNNSMAYYYRGSSKIYIRDSKGANDDLTKDVEISLSS